MSKLERLIATLDQYPKIAIAVSGGVDSMLLMYVAHEYSATAAVAMHACSPAVPRSAFTRLKKFAQEQRWQLRCLDAGELADDNYRRNPGNRCYFCKTNLFSRIADDLKIDTDGNHVSVIASGTNLDDLNDYRPGLQAAKEFSVVQPYVDAAFTKADIYALAKAFGLRELENLPAQPCLASRIETGISVKQQDLEFIDRIESFLRTQLGQTETLRCRITQQGVVLEFASLPQATELENIEHKLRAECTGSGRFYAGVKRYQKGSAFIIGKAS